MAAPDTVLVAGARTPFGAFGGSLKDLSAADLGAHAARAALSRGGVDPAVIDSVVFGNVVQNEGQSIYLARHIGLRCGCPPTTDALVVNRLCGSGLEAIVTGGRLLQSGAAAWVLAGGTESMSQAPYLARGARWGMRMGPGQLEDMLSSALEDRGCGCSMAETSENLVRDYGLTRAEIDQVAWDSQRRAKAAWADGRMAAEVAPVEVRGRGKTLVVDRDEHMRPETTPETLAALKPFFRADGTVTAGNASGIVDGAAAVVLTSAAVAAAAGLPPLARLVAAAVVGVDPTRMGIGPAPAIRRALTQAGLDMSDVDLWEINEAFAGQYLAVERELGLDRAAVNVNGGAIALGHPLGASGTRLALTLCLELRRRGGRYGVAALCIGGGQGIAAVFAAV